MKKLCIIFLLVISCETSNENIDSKYTSFYSHDELKALENEQKAFYLAEKSLYFERIDSSNPYSDLEEFPESDKNSWGFFSNIEMSYKIKSNENKLSKSYFLVFDFMKKEEKLAKYYNFGKMSLSGSSMLNLSNNGFPGQHLYFNVDPVFTYRGISLIDHKTSIYLTDYGHDVDEIILKSEDSPDVEAFEFNDPISFNAQFENKLDFTSTTAILDADLNLKDFSIDFKKMGNIEEDIVDLQLTVNVKIDEAIEGANTINNSFNRSERDYKAIYRPSSSQESLFLSRSEYEKVASKVKINFSKYINANFDISVSESDIRVDHVKFETRVARIQKEHIPLTLKSDASSLKLDYYKINSLRFTLPSID